MVVKGDGSPRGPHDGVGGWNRCSDRGGVTLFVVVRCEVVRRWRNDGHENTVLSAGA